MDLAATVCRVAFDNGTVRVSPSSTPLPPNSRVEVLSTSTGNLQVIDDFAPGSSITMQASVGDRILLLIAEKNTDASQPVSIVFNKPIFVSGDADTYLNAAIDWRPTLPSAAPGTFGMADLLRFAGAAR